MNDNPIVFEEKGHPTIKVFEDRISIKSKDYSNFRDFQFDKIKSLTFYQPGGFLRFLYELNSIWRKYSKEDDYVLRVKLKDGEYWDYETTHNYNPSFKALIETLQSKL